MHPTVTAFNEQFPRQKSLESFTDAITFLCFLREDRKYKQLTNDRDFDTIVANVGKCVYGVPETEIIPDRESIHSLLKVRDIWPYMWGEIDPSNLEASSCFSEVRPPRKHSSALEAKLEPEKTTISKNVVRRTKNSIPVSELHGVHESEEVRKERLKTFEPRLQ